MNMMKKNKLCDCSPIYISEMKLASTKHSGDIILSEWNQIHHICLSYSNGFKTLVDSLQARDRTSTFSWFS